MIESILQPSAKIKENYHSLTVVVDGLITSGVRVRETDSELVLRDAEDREVTLPIDAIEARKDGGSLMPVGLADSLTRGELVDLVRFLSELGKVGPYSVGNARVARRWEALQASDAAAKQLGQQDKLDLSTLAGSDWTTVYGQVSGDVPLADIPAISTASGPVRLVRCQLEVSVGGKITLATSGPVEKVWVDADAVGGSGKVTVELTPGVHTVTLLLDREDSDRVALALEDVSGSAAQAQFVGGK